LCKTRNAVSYSGRRQTEPDNSVHVLLRALLGVTYERVPGNINQKHTKKEKMNKTTELMKEVCKLRGWPPDAEVDLGNFSLGAVLGVMILAELREISHKSKTYKEGEKNHGEERIYGDNSNPTNM